MLAELAAFNAAFATVKGTISAGKSLAAAAQSIGQMVDSKDTLHQKLQKKKNSPFSRQVETDLEEFMALEKIREQEEQLKQFMIYAGRPGLWNDWQRFQAEARKSRRVQEELAKRRREEIMEMVGYGVAALIVIAGIAGLAAWALWMKGVF